MRLGLISWPGNVENVTIRERRTGGAILEIKERILIGSWFTKCLFQWTGRRGSGIDGRVRGAG